MCREVKHKYNLGSFVRKPKEMLFFQDPSFLFFFFDEHRIYKAGSDLSNHGVQPLLFTDEEIVAQKDDLPCSAFTQLTW